MAPALTEPLSPKEKLSSSAATASLSTRATKKVESSSSTSPSTSAASASLASSDENPVTQQQQHTTSNNIKEKKPSRNTPTPTTSTRITRSKDSQQQSNSNTPSPKLVAAASTASSSIATRKNNKLSPSNEQQMGLSAARNSNNNPSNSNHNNNNNNNNNNNKSPSDKEVESTTVQSETTVLVEQQTQSEEKKLPESQGGEVVPPNSKDNSTEQLLADLTNDFEEAITAEICLRNQLPEVTLSKEPTTSDTTTLGNESATEKEKSTVISSAAGDIPVETAVAALQHMESQLLSNATTQEDATTVCCPPPTNDDLVAAAVDSAVSVDLPNETVPPAAVTSKPDEILSSNVTPSEDAASTSLSLNKTSAEKPSCSRAHIISMEILPPVGTDSTITASEIDDNLEERLSQLDGKTTFEPPLPPPPAAAEPQVENQLQLSPLRNINLQQLQEQLASTSSSPSTSSAAFQQQQQQQLASTSSSPSTSSAAFQQQQQQLASTSSSPSTSSAAFQQQQQQQQQQLGVTTTTSPTNASAASILNNSNSNLLQQGFLKENNAAGDELADQDIEEVLKALKGFDNGSNADTLVDLNVFFNDVFQSVNPYPNFEDVNNTQNPSTSVQKSLSIQESYADVAKKQEMLTSKIDTLLRRMRKLQARHMCKHTSTEIAGLFEWSSRISTKNSHPVRSNMLSEQESAVMSVVSGRAPLGFWYEQSRNPVPSAQVSSMLRELRTVAKEQQLSTTPTHSTQSYNSAFQTKRARKHDGSGTAASHVNTNASVVGETKSEPVIIPNFDSYVAGELTHVAGLLHTEMREVQNAIDSDATESSSGGESADEMVNYNNQVQQPLSISKRAVWRYARDRAAIALRWSWLLTQVNDLEVKIRQHSIVQNDANISRGSILLEPVPHPEAVKSQDVSNTVNNGYKNAVANDSDSDVEATACSRTRGLNLSEFRKRKLFQTTNMHTISKKAARPSTIKCGCQWPKLPCALCTGRADPTAPRALPDTMMMPNRVALLDSGYHPMLSFPEEITHSIHFESICRQPEWQQRVMRCQAKAIAKNVWKAEREAVAVLTGTRKQGGDQTKRRYVRRKERNTTGNDDKTSTKGGAGVVINDSGNGTAPSSTSCTTTSSTPLVANRGSVKQRQRRSKNNKNLATMPNENLSNKIDQQNYYSQTQLSLISSNSSNNKNRKTSANSNNFNSLNLNQYNNAAVHLMNPSSATAAASTSNINGDNTFLNSSSGDQLDGSLAKQRSRTASPTQGSSKGKGKNRSNRSRVSYDIDNIVIPYSIAAATRVEILPYKEIPTPKWRVIGDDDDGGDDENDQHSKPKEDELQKCCDKDSAAPAPARASQATKKFNGGKDAMKHTQVNKTKIKDIDNSKAALKSHQHKIKDSKISDVVEARSKITKKANGTFLKIEKETKILKVATATTTTTTTKDAIDIATIKEASSNKRQIKEEKLLKKEKDSDDSNSLNVGNDDFKFVTPLKTNNSLINGKIKANDQGSITATAVMDDKKGLKNIDTPAIKTQNNNILKMKNIDEVFNSTQNTNIKTEAPIDVHNNVKEEKEDGDSKTTATTTATVDLDSLSSDVIKKSSIEVQNIQIKAEVCSTSSKAALESPLSDPLLVIKKLNNVLKVKDEEGTTKTKTSDFISPLPHPLAVIKKKLVVDKVKEATTTSGWKSPSSDPLLVHKKPNNVHEDKSKDCAKKTETTAHFISPSSHPFMKIRKPNNVHKAKVGDCPTTTKTSDFISPSPHPLMVVKKKHVDIKTTATLNSPSSDSLLAAKKFNNFHKKKHIGNVLKLKKGIKTATVTLDSFSQPEIKKPKLENGENAAKAKDDTDSMKAPPPPPPPPNIIREREVGTSSSVAAASSSLLEDESEDTSEELFLARHQRALIEERRKFITYLKFPFSTRSRANRRVDSRAESSGTNTPDPMSPAPQTPVIGGGGDESIPSPLAQTHSHTNPMDLINESISDSIYAIGNTNSRAQNKRQERRRTTSMKNKELERRSASPEFEPPYEPLQFPLPEDTYQKMLKEMEESYERKRVFFRFIEGGSSSHGGPSTSRAASSARDVGGSAKRSKSGKSSTTSQRDVAPTSSSSSTRRKSNPNRKVNNSSAKRKEVNQQRPNGKLPIVAVPEGDDDDNDDEDDDDLPVLLTEDLLNEVDDDDYPKHYLAPNDDSNYFDEGADDSNKHSLRQDDSETDDADDPFVDDDPNDPEWKRSLGERKKV